VYGRKEFTLVSPFYTPRLYNDNGFYSSVDPKHPDYGRHPKFEGVDQLEILLEPGEALLIPVGWWHRVESLDVCISLSFNNFAYPNRYVW